MAKVQIPQYLSQSGKVLCIGAEWYLLPSLSLKFFLPSLLDSGCLGWNSFGHDLVSLVQKKKDATFILNVSYNTSWSQLSVLYDQG